jgi:hypothetical protein
MPTDLKEIIDQLKLERDILKSGGYGRSVRTPWKPTMLFRDSVTCLNFDEAIKRHPCNECFLWEWVPENHRDEDLPCHFIPLNERGENIASLEDVEDREEAEKALLGWLDSLLAHLEAKLAGEQKAGTSGSLVCHQQHEH